MRRRGGGGKEDEREYRLEVLIFLIFHIPSGGKASEKKGEKVLVTLLAFEHGRPANVTKKKRGKDLDILPWCRAGRSTEGRSHKNLRRIGGPISLKPVGGKNSRKEKKGRSRSGRLFFRTFAEREVPAPEAEERKARQGSFFFLNRPAGKRLRGARFVVASFSLQARIPGEKERKKSREEIRRAPVTFHFFQPELGGGRKKRGKARVLHLIYVPNMPRWY